jgi:integrase
MGGNSVAKTYAKLTARELPKVKPGDKKVCEHGITFRRAENGDGIWGVEIMVDGQRIKRTLGTESAGVTRKQAETFIEQARTDARHGRLNLPKGRKTVLRFDDAAEQYLQRLEESGGKNLKKKREQLRLHLTPFFGAMPLSSITTFAVDRYKRMRLGETKKPGNRQRAEGKPAEPVKPGTINRELAVLSHLFHKAVEWGWISHLPVNIRRLKEGSGRIEYLTVEQAEGLRQAAKTDRNPHLYLFVCIGLETSMRKMEILRLRREHVHLDRRVLYIPSAKAGAREQPITGSLAEQIRGHLAALPKSCDWLFPSNRAKPGHASDVKDAFKRAVKVAGLDPKAVVRHTLRHTAITHLVQAGVDLPTVQRISGHRTLAMVARYAHANGAHVQEAMSALERRYRDREAGTKSRHQAIIRPLSQRTGTLG